MLANERWLSWAAKHPYASFMHNGATDDYISARCLLLNGFFTGHPLFSTATEKLLKCAIYLESGMPPTLKTPNKHDILLLADELSKSSAAYLFEQRSDLYKRMNGHYKTRYFDNLDSSQSMSSNEIEEFDVLFIGLMQTLPIPSENKMRLKIYTELFDERTRRLFPQAHYWATFNNYGLEQELHKLEMEYRAVHST